MNLRTAARQLIAVVDGNPDALWPRCTEAVENLRAEVNAQRPVAWRYQHEGRWVYTTRDPRLILSDVTPEPLYL